MYRSNWAPLACAVAIAFAAAPMGNRAAAQSSKSETTPLPPVVVEQSAEPAAAKPAKKKKTAPSAAGEAAPEGPPTGDQAATGEATPAIGVGTKGLAVPLNTTRLTSAAIKSQLPSTSDTAQILRNAPGVSIFTSGGVSGLPAINGLNDDRVKVLLNGMVVTSACPNHMNPPLSYIDPSQVVIADVIAGVTPVSVGGDSLGGTVIVESAVPRFATGEGVRTAGSISAYYHSNGDHVGTAAQASAATANVSLGYAGAWTKTDNYTRGDDGPEVLSTLYEAQNHALTFAARSGSDLFIVQGTYASIPYQGYVNQRMDMIENEAWLLNARYVGHFDWGLLDARAFHHDTKHRMDILEDKGGTMPMNVDGTDSGYSLKAEIPLSTADVLRIGSEFHHETLEDWWPPVAGKAPMMGPDTFININDGRRDRLGTFAEWEHKWDRAWSTLIGIRNDTVWMDTGDVKGYSMMYAADAAAFNSRDHQRTDVNFDVTALARFEPTATETYEVGYARKTRSPNLYERYAWSTGDMAADMIGWYGDANGYIGNLDLEPEIAHTASITAGWHDEAHRSWELKVTPYYTYVEDYIDANFVKKQMMNKNFVTLRFANHDARLYGINVSGSVALWRSADAGRFDLSGLLGYVNGENLDTGDNLYHMMPINARLALSHRLGGWSNALEVVAVSRKSEVNDLRNEPVTPGYALVNLRTSYEWQNVRFDLGVENVFDKLYYPPLGGVDWADYKVAGAKGTISPVPGEGRSFNAGITLSF